MPSAFSHDPSITVPSSSTDNAIAIFDGTGGSGFGNSTILVDSGGNGRIGIAGDTDVIIVTANTVTVAGTVAATTLTGNGAGVTALAAGNIASGTVATARLGSGTANNTVFLRGDGTWAAPSSGPSQASATETESQTNVDKYVPPDLLHRHHGVAKATWNGNANVATMAEHASYGMDSFTDNGVGDYTFTFDTAFSSVNYSWAASAGHIAGELVGGITVNQYDADASARTTTTLRIYVAYGHYTSGPLSGHNFSTVDCNELDLIVFGDQ